MIHASARILGYMYMHGSCHGYRSTSDVHVKLDLPVRGVVIADGLVDVWT